MSIHIEDLTVRFKNSVTAIDHADLDIPNGIFGLLGENGAGKTTLMRVFTTVLKPTNGMVTLDGILYSEGNYEKIQRKIGYLPQEIELYPNLTVQECLEYMGDLAGVPKAECRKRIDYYLKKNMKVKQSNTEIIRRSQINLNPLNPKRHTPHSTWISYITKISAKNRLLSAS